MPIGREWAKRPYLCRVCPCQVRMLIDSLLRFSSNQDEVKDKVKASDELMPKSLSKKLASISGQSIDRVEAQVDPESISLDKLTELARKVLLDEDLEVSKVRPFFWTMVETYVDRFQVFPFDAIKVLFSYLELHEYPEEELRDLVKRLEKLYKKEHGSSLRKSGQASAVDSTGGQTLDEEISQLRETLKYAAIVGERTDDEK